MKKRVKKVNQMKSISKVVVVLAFLTAMLGIETQVVAQINSRLGDPPPTISYSNSVITTNCCPWVKQVLDSATNNAPFVFEGRMIVESMSPYSFLFEIEKVYRGGERLQAGTVEILVGLSDREASMSLTIFLSGWHVIFAKEVVGYGAGAFDANNSIKLELYSVYDENYLYIPSYFGPKMHNIHSDGGALYSREFSHYTGFGLNFRTEEEVRNFLKTYCNLSPTDMPKADTVKNQTFYDIERAKAAKERSIKDAEERVKKEETKKEYYRFLLESRMKNQKEIDDAMLEFENASDSIRGRKLENEMNLRDSIINEGLQKKSQGEQKRGDTIATLTSIIRNDIIIKDAADRYLEFDIMVNSDIAGTYPYGLNIELAYSSNSLEQPFKKCIYDIRPEEIWIDTGALFKVVGQVFPLLKILTRSDTAIALYFRSSYHPNDTILFELPTTETLFAHVKMRINGDYSGNVLIEPRISSAFYNTTHIANIYATKNYTRNCQNKLISLGDPVPVITDYYINTPNNVSGCAGCGDSLIIQGYNFGTKDIKNPNDTLAALLFKLADYPVSNPYDAPYYKIRDNSDFLFWSDTLIKIKLPSVAIKKDKKYEELGQHPGTGQFIVQARNGNRDTSAYGFIEINYAILNSRYADSIKYMPLIPKRDCFNGYKFQVDSNIAKDAPAIACIKKAMRVWSDSLGIVLELEIDSVTNKPKINPNPKPWALDDIHTISYTCSYGKDTIDLMGTLPRMNHCQAGLGYYRDIDIGICSATNWYKDTTTPIPSSSTQYCFYTSILHELGHALGMGHTFNTKDLMIPVVGEGKRKDIDTNAVSGVNHLIRLSSDTTINWVGCLTSTYLEVLNTESVFCPITPLPSITIQCTVLSSTSIKVVWNGIIGADNYILDYSLDSDFYTSLGTYTLPYNTTSKIFAGLTPGTTYYFRVKAYNSSGNLAYGETSGKCGRFDLYIKDNEKVNDDDDGTEPNPTLQYMWTSPWIWVRHKPDSVYQGQNPKPDTLNYVYVKIKNRGNIASLGNEKLHLYWAKASTTLPWPENWTGNSSFPGGSLKGKLIDSVPIPIVPPDSTVIIEIPWWTPNPVNYYSFSGHDSWHFCLLGRIVSSIDTMTKKETTDLNYNCRQNNNIAWVNVHFIHPNIGIIGGTVLVGNVNNLPSVSRLDILAEAASEGIFSESEITFRVENAIYQAWLRGGMQCKNMVFKGNQTFLITGAGASLRNLKFNAREVGTVSLQFNFLTRELTPQTNYVCHLVQTDTLPNTAIGGEVYSITKSPRVPFYASAEDVYALQNESILLRAEEIAEPARYNWYDRNGNLVCGETIFRTVAVEEQLYKLEVIALADGYKDYTTVAVKIVPGKIESIFPNPATSSVTVRCIFNKASNVQIVVTDYSGLIYNTFLVNMSPQNITFNTFNYPTGTYIVKLFCNGQVADTKTFVKQ